MRKWIINSVLAGCLILLLGCQTNIEFELEDNSFLTYHQFTAENGRTLRFAVILPESYHPEESYPTMLAFPPGEQSAEMVQFEIEEYWIKACIQHNWIVICPIAPDGISFYNGSEVLVPELMDWVEERHNVEGGKFHLSGASAGGYSSFRVAVEYPDRVHSILGFPGYPFDDDFAKLDRLTGMPVGLYVGFYDYDFVTQMERTYQRLQELGNPVIYRVLPMDSHVIESVSAEGWMSVMESFREQVN